MLCGQSINGGVLNCLRWWRERDCIYYYCYYTVVVIMLCVLEYAVLMVSNRASAVRRISRACENSLYAQLRCQT